MTERKDILLTGSSGFLGKHLLPELDGYNVKTLGRRPDNDYFMDLEYEYDGIVLPRFDAVIHVAGTYQSDRADNLNYQGTRRLLQALEQNPPRHFTLISSVHVYGDNPGQDVEETTFLRPHTPYSRSKINAEKECERWCAARNVELTILRVAAMAGDGMHGSLKEMAEGVRTGKYFHIRGNDARRSIVMACDVAKVVEKTLNVPGIFNVADGANRTVIELADAMSLNYGKDKRVLTVPAMPLKVASFIASIFPPLRRFIDSRICKLTTSATFSSKKICENIGITFFDTVEVIARRDPDYPYKDE